MADRKVGLALFTFALLPVPFDIAGIWAGTVRYSPARFLLYVAAGKIIKFTVLAFGGFFGISWLLKLLGA